ncbi:MAG: hypothetical protein R6X02_10075 [Enhygromyxa sp.]
MTAILTALGGCLMSNPAFNAEQASEGDTEVGEGDQGEGDQGEGDGDPGDGDPGDGDPGEGDGEGDGDPGDGDGDGDPGDGDGEPGCSPPLIDCFGACVDLDSDPSHCGGCGQPCVGLCELGVCDESAERLVFLTSQPQKGAMGGLEGADGWCKELANSAGLEGDFKAWLSTAQLGPASRMAHFSGPYRLLDGTLVANGWADLTDGSLAHPIDLDETGAPVSSAYVCQGHEVWTNTKADGTPRSNLDCNAWQETTGTSNTGRYTEIDASWTASTCVSVDCAASLPIYCVQQ